jgi:hypothetical protein
MAAYCVKKQDEAKNAIEQKKISFQIGCALQKRRQFYYE